MDSHDLTDRKLERLEKRIRRTYKRADREIKEKSKSYYKRTKELDVEKQRAVANGEMTKAEYKMWKAERFTQNEHYKIMQRQCNEVWLNANKEALEYTNGMLPEIYSINYKAENENIADAVVQGYSYELVDRMTVREMIRTNENRLPKMSAEGTKELQKAIDEGRAEKWDTKKMNAEMLQGIIQGESVDKMAKRLQNVTTMDRNAAIRNARTMVTGAECKGRLASYRDAESKGVILKKQWIATHDGHTRDSHAWCDGEIVDIEDTFSNDLMYPAEYGGPPAEVYNCRCTMVSVVTGFRNDITGEIVSVDYNESYSALSEEYWKNAKGEEWYGDKYLKNEVNYRQILLEQTDKDRVYSGIWKNDVKVSDYPSKKGSIQAKRDYYEHMISVSTDDAEIAKFEEYLRQLDEFERKGIEYEKAFNNYNTATKNLWDFGKNNGSAVITQDRLDAAYWFTQYNGGSMGADGVLRDCAGKSWLSMTESEKDALYKYTYTYNRYNRPLRGFDYDRNVYVGIENIDFDNIGYFPRGETKREINEITHAISKSKVPADIWVTRGCQYDTMDRFLGIDSHTLRYGSNDELEKALLGNKCVEHGFMSTGTSKGSGFGGGVKLNIFVPQGTEAMYVEPISDFGLGDKRDWDGISKQRSISSESELLIQRETEFVINRVYRENGTLYVDLITTGQNWSDIQ